MKHKQTTFHILGIGGISLSALAILLKAKGYMVTGVDDVPSEVLTVLKKKGIKTRLHSCKTWVKQADVVVYSSAISETHPDLILAKKMQKVVCSRAQLLGAVASSYAKTVAISGAHGKTTCTAMVAQMLLMASRLPTVHVGGMFPFLQGNVFVGQDDVFVTEACEYKDSFLQLSPYISVILNVQPDHLDYFKTFRNMQHSFATFAHNTNPDGFCIVNQDDATCRDITSFAHSISFGTLAPADITAKNCELNAQGQASFDVFVFENFIGRISLRVAGEHQVYNALAALSVGLCLGLSFKECVVGLEHFTGVDRRFQEMGQVHGARVIADYAHHPDEIKATLALCKQITTGKLYVVFQPHTFSRTRDLWDAFVHAFAGVYELCVAPIYPAREQPISGITHMRLAQAVQETGVKASGKTIEEMLVYFPQVLQPDDVLLVLGAGDIIAFAKQVAKAHE